MKKITSIAAVALFCALAFTSCEKDYKCTCTVTSNGQSYTGTSSSFKAKKGEAKDTCNEGDSEMTVAGVTTKTDCELD